MGSSTMSLSREATPLSTSLARVFSCEKTDIADAHSFRLLNKVIWGLYDHENGTCLASNMVFSEKDRYDESIGPHQNLDPSL